MQSDTVLIEDGSGTDSEGESESVSMYTKGSGSGHEKARNQEQNAGQIPLFSSAFESKFRKRKQQRRRTKGKGKSKSHSGGAHLESESESESESANHSGQHKKKGDGDKGKGNGDSWCSWGCWIAIVALFAILVMVKYQEEGYNPILADQYDVLGLSSDVGNDEVKKRYRKLALSLHPDKCREDSDVCVEKFLKVKAAYHAIVGRDDSFESLTREHYGPFAESMLAKKKREKFMRDFREKEKKKNVNN